MTIEARYQDNDSGTVQHMTPGFWITFRDALVQMIIVSDGTPGFAAAYQLIGRMSRLCWNALA